MFPLPFLAETSRNKRQRDRKKNERKFINVYTSRADARYPGKLRWLAP